MTYRLGRDVGGTFTGGLLVFFACELFGARRTSR